MLQPFAEQHGACSVLHCSPGILFHVSPGKATEETQRVSIAMVMITMLIINVIDDDDGDDDAQHGP